MNKREQEERTESDYNLKEKKDDMKEYEDLSNATEISEVKVCGKSEKKKIITYAALAACVSLACLAIFLWKPIGDGEIDGGVRSGAGQNVGKTDDGRVSDSGGSGSEGNAEGNVGADEEGAKKPEEDEDLGGIKDKIIGVIDGGASGATSPNSLNGHEYKAYTVRAGWIEQGDALMRSFRSESVNVRSGVDSPVYVATIGSEKDLARFMDELREPFNLGDGSRESDFSGKSKHWDKNFFADKVVFVAYCTSNSGSRASIKDVSKSGSTLTINLESNNSGMSTAVMSGYFVVVEVDRGCLSGVESCAIAWRGAAGNLGGYRLGK